MFDKQKKEHVLTLLMLVLLVVNAVCLLWYVAFGYRGLFHSDSAAKVLLAREIFETGDFFPREWNYVNGDLWVFFGHMLIVPLLAFMPAGFAVHAISGLIFSCLIACGVWLVVGMMEIPLWRKILIIAVVLSGISGYMAENMYGQVSYGPTFFSCCCLVFFSWKYSSGDDRFGKIWALLLIVFLVMVYWGNPKRAIVTYGAPLFAAFVYQFLAKEGKERRLYLMLIIFGCVGAFLGTWLHVATMMNVNNVDGTAAARWLPFESILRHIVLAFKGFLGLLGGLPAADSPLFSWRGLYSEVRLIVACLILAIIPLAIVRFLRGSGEGGKMIGLFAFFIIAISLFMQVATTIPNMNDPVSVSRYLVPGVVLGLICLLGMPLVLTQSPGLIMAVAAIFFVLVSNAVVICGVPNSFSRGTIASPWRADSYSDPIRQELIGILRENGLEYGYASFWNAGVLSVLSNEEVRVRQIVIQNGMPAPFRWLSSNRWYRPAAWSGKTFLLLDEKEADLVNLDKMAEFGMPLQATLRAAGYVIFIFAENIARLPGWDMSYKMPVFFPVGSSSLSQIGHIIKEGAGAKLIAQKGEIGFLHYGPYVNVEPGRYRVTFDIATNYHPDGSAKLDVVSSGGAEVLGQRVITESSGTQWIDFSVDMSSVMEFRVFALGNEEVIFKGVSIVRISDVH